MKTYKRLSIGEREIISQMLYSGYSLRKISESLDRNVTTISREVAPFSVLGKPYKAYLADKCSNILSRRTRKNKLETNPKLLRFVKEKLALRWSPEQISRALKNQYPLDKHMQASHETIYTYIYLHTKGELKKELTGYLRQKKRLRKNRKSVKDQRGVIVDMVSIDERPKEVNARIVPGHWEGDLIMGKGHKSALGVIVERKNRFVILAPLKAKTAPEVRKAFTKEFKSLPKQMAISMTYDRGKEMAEHKLFTKNTKIKVYFCHPASPWERPTCENTNMLIRDFFPKKTDFNEISRKEIKKVQNWLNERPRKTLDWKTPKETFYKSFVALET